MENVLEKLTRKLYDATQRRCICSVSMTGEPEPRIIHPYGLCQTTRGQITIVCWQEGGYSRASRLPGYRNLNLMNCTTVELVDRHFLVRADFNAADSSYQDWVFHVT